jgi:hypothetical protein
VIVERSGKFPDRCLNGAERDAAMKKPIKTRALFLGVLLALLGTAPSWAQRSEVAKGGESPPSRVAPHGRAGNRDDAPAVLKGRVTMRTRAPAPGAPQVAEISPGPARVNPLDAVQVTIFDGFEMKTIGVDKDGTYSSPIAKTSDGTLLAVYATRVAVAPQARQVRVRRSPSPLSLEVADIQLAPLEQPNVGTVVGHAFIRTEGGRANRQRGIVRFDSDLPLTVEGANFKAELNTDKNGAFELKLPPGPYRIITARNVVKKIVVRPGQTTIAPIQSSQITY